VGLPALYQRKNATVSQRSTCNRSIFESSLQQHSLIFFSGHTPYDPEYTEIADTLVVGTSPIYGCRCNIQHDDYQLSAAHA